jgi:pyruvate dehydrogenase E2 component (dihydrolipoamide acetyltransferase)
METGRLVEWLKHDGDRVQAGENLFTVESDKAVIEVEALDSGILRIPPDAPSADVDVPVGTTLAYLLGADETPVWVSASFENGLASDSPSTITAEDSELATPLEHDRGAMAHPATSSDKDPAISPRARRIAAELGVDWSALAGSGRSGRIVERDVRAALRPARGVRATPLARRIAAETGVDLTEIATIDGMKRISRADVDAAAAAKRATAVPDSGTPLTSIRRITAQRMTESARTTAPVTLTTEADATELVALRSKIKTDAGPSNVAVPSYTDLLARLVALVLLDHPALNATLRDDTLITHDTVHIGIAVDTERGLMVPVVRDAHIKSVGQIAAETARLVEQARLGRSAPDDLHGSTFTITNLGMYDIDAFTPIINLPECAILGVGRIVSRLQLVDEGTEKAAFRKMVTLSLTFDHRIVDGAPAARFLQQIKHWVEHPYAWITR